MKWILVSYFFPPKNNIAAQRWGRFSKDLSSKGIPIEAYTGPWGAKRQEENLKIFPISDPISSDAKPSPQNLNQHKISWKGKLLNRLPLFLLIDGKWLWSLKVFFSLLFSSSHPQAVIVTGSPWSAVFAIALLCRLKRWPLTIEFRDFWAFEPYRLHFENERARSYFRRLENFCLKSAQQIIVINSEMEKYFRTLAPELPILQIPHGLQKLESESNINERHETKPRILYAGSISNYHGLDLFFKTLKDLGLEALEPYLCFMGTDYTSVLDSKGIQRLPEGSEQEAMKEMKNSGLLFLSLNREATHYTTGKLWSYIEAARPILYFGPPSSPAAKWIKDLDIGWVIDIDQPQSLLQIAPKLLDFLTNGNPLDLKFRTQSLHDLQVNVLMEKLIKTLRPQSLDDIPIKNSRALWNEQSNFKT